jgi:diaminopimelate decarboxylase
LPSCVSGADELVQIDGGQDDLSVDESGVLAIEGVSAAELLEAYGSPLYVVSESTLRRNFRRIRNAFSEAWPNQVTVHYALKSNNNFAVRAILYEEGAGGDCFGEGELYATFVGGANPANIVMNGSSKSMRELKKAVDLGICINVDNEDELDFLEEILAASSQRARVALRLLVIPPAFDPNGVLGAYPWGFPEESAEPLVKRMADHPSLIFEGYSVHVGRMSPDLDFFRAWAGQLGEMVVSLYTKTGVTPRRIDVGGGFPRRRDVEAGYDAADQPREYLNPHSIEEYADAVCKPLLDALARSSLTAPELAIEPGRYIVGSAVTLLSTVGAVKSHSGSTWVNVDVSVNNLMMRETRNYEHWILPASRMKDELSTRCFVNGPICMGKPLGRDVRLPQVRRGDTFAILDAGMYAETLSTQLNGVPRPATVLVNQGRHELIKERESLNDVFAKFRLPERFRAYGGAER